MAADGRQSNGRVMALGAFAGGVVATLAVVIVVAFFMGLGPFGDPEPTQTTSRTSREPREPQPTPEDTPAIAEGVQLVGIIPSPWILQIAGPNESAEIQLQGYYSDDSVGGLPQDSGDTAEFVSSNPEVADVSSRGVVRGESVGGAEISVSYGKFSATVPVLVWGDGEGVPAINPDNLLPDDAGESSIVLNRIIVELAPGSGAEDATQLAGSVNGNVVFDYSTFPGFVIELEETTLDDLKDLLSTLQADSRVAQAYPDLLIPPSQDSGLAEVETLLRSPDLGLAYLQSGMQEAWQRMSGLQTVNAEPVVIAVIDSAFTEPATEDNAVGELLSREFDYHRIAIVDGIAGEGRNARHGTSVTSVISAINNDATDSSVPEESFSGVVSSVDSIEYFVMFYEVGGDEEGNQSIAGIINALEEISAFQDIIDVVNFSTSAVCSDYLNEEVQEVYDENPQYDPCQWIDSWAALIQSMPDVTFVSSAGNTAGAGGEARDVYARDRDDRVFPAAFSLELDNAITVGGTWAANPLGRATGWVYDRAAGSNYGDPITIGAPYDVWAMDIEDSDGYSHQSGTSFSAPMVSGAVALLKALEPSLTPTQIKEILTATGTIIQVCNSDRSHPSEVCPEEEQEWRNLDAGAAVKEVLRRSVKANIDLTLADNPDRAALLSSVDLEIPVKNEGDYTWSFHMDATVCAPSGAGYVYQLPLPNLIRPGGTAVFPLSFEATEPGTWRVDVGAYRDSAEADPQRSSSLDEDELHIFVRGGGRAAQPAQPTGQTEEAPTTASESGATPAGTTPAPDGAREVKCVAQQEGEAAGLAGKDANVVLVADTSGSMDGAKIQEVKRTALDFFGNVTDPAEFVALLDFDDHVREVIELSARGSITDAEWENAVATLDSDGGTAFYDAVVYAVDMLEEIGARDRVNIIIALTDGEDSDSRASFSDAIAKLEGATVPITLFTVAYGGSGGYNKNVLDQLAIAGGSIRSIPGDPESTEQLFIVLATVFARS